jgi:hypothetical protein
MNDIFVAKSTFTCTVDGKRCTVRKGSTMVRQGHPVLKGREHLFEPVTPSPGFDVPEKQPKKATKKQKKAEEATAAPGELRDLTGE